MKKLIVKAIILMMFLSPTMIFIKIDVLSATIGGIALALCIMVDEYYQEKEEWDKKPLEKASTYLFVQKDKQIQKAVKYINNHTFYSEFRDGNGKITSEHTMFDSTSDPRDLLEILGDKE